MTWLFRISGPGHVDRIEQVAFTNPVTMQTNSPSWWKMICVYLAIKAQGVVQAEKVFIIACRQIVEPPGTIVEVTPMTWPVLAVIHRDEESQWQVEYTRTQSACCRPDCKAADFINLNLTMWRPFKQNLNTFTFLFFIYIGRMELMQPCGFAKNAFWTCKIHG